MITNQSVSQSALLLALPFYPGRPRNGVVIAYVIGAHKNIKPIITVEISDYLKKSILKIKDYTGVVHSKHLYNKLHE